MDLNKKIIATIEINKSGKKGPVARASGTNKHKYLIQLSLLNSAFFM